MELLRLNHEITIKSQPLSMKHFLFLSLLLIINDQAVEVE